MGVLLNRIKYNKYNLIKEAFDNLQSGICFFSENQVVVLCNTVMRDLVYTLTGKDLQVISDIKDGLENPHNNVKIINKNISSYIFPDGKVWDFFEDIVVDVDGNSYTQITARDVTKLYRTTEELEKQNIELEKLIEQFQRIAKNMVDIARQEEILSAKMRIHNKMGNCVMNTQHFCQEDCPNGKKQELINIWKETLRALEEEIGQEDDTNSFYELVRIANNCGVNIKIYGELKEDKSNSYLAVLAIRECLTNAILHGDGKTLNVYVENTQLLVEIIIMNDGKVQNKSIIEGGGLSSLRKKIENAGGEMIVSSENVFTVTIRYPNV